MFVENNKLRKLICKERKFREKKTPSICMKPRKISLKAYFIVFQHGVNKKLYQEQN